MQLGRKDCAIIYFETKVNLMYGAYKFSQLVYQIHLLSITENIIQVDRVEVLAAGTIYEED